MEFDSGMQRNSAEGKIDFTLILPEGIPYEEQMLYRFADHLTKGAKVYSERNWEKASGVKEMTRFKKSALRHFMQWYFGFSDEDHASAVWFNIMGYETTKYKVENAVDKI
jgi:hypothetical protein